MARIETRVIRRELLHSWFKLRWTPSSRSWLLSLDKKIRARISHKNNAEQINVTLDDQVHSIWTVRVEGDCHDTVPVVIIHGMGGGSNMFLNNIDALAEERDVILIDLPGFGLSSRPELRVKYENGWWVNTTVDDIEEFYTEVLDQWFQRMQLNSVILLGHSYGGYLCSVYCLKYPSRVKHLILADPWGFPQRPLLADMRPFMRSKPLYLLSKLYSKMNIFTPLRILGPLGPLVFRFLRADLGRKYKSFFSDHTFLDYFYACNTCSSPSGEIGFARVSIPFGWAKKPLVERVPAWDANLDVTFIYGARSWVDSQPGYETKNHRHSYYIDVHVISGAGHHVYADRPVAFNHIVQMIGEAVDRSRKPNISQEFEQRHLAMSTLRRRSSCSSQAEICNDEAGLRQIRSLSSHELGYYTDMGSSAEEMGTIGTVKFTLDEEEEEENEDSSISATLNAEGDSSKVTKQSTLKMSTQTKIKNVQFSTSELTISSDSNAGHNVSENTTEESATETSIEEYIPSD